jgi:hypothetical protein
MQSLEYFSMLKAAATGDVVTLVKFFEEDQQLIKAFQAIGDVGYEAMARAIADARYSRRPEREIESALTLLRQTHVAYTKALNAVPPSGKPEPQGLRDWMWAIKREMRTQGNIQAGKWSQDAEQALAVCRVSALICMCHCYLGEPAVLARWLGQLRADFATFARFHPDSGSGYGPTFGSRDLSEDFAHLPYAELQSAVSDLYDGLALTVDRRSPSVRDGSAGGSDHAPSYATWGPVGSRAASAELEHHEQASRDATGPKMDPGFDPASTYRRHN